MGESHGVSLQCRQAGHIQSLARGEAEISGKGNQEEAEASDEGFHQPQSRGTTFGSRTRDGVGGTQANLSLSPSFYTRWPPNRADS